MGAEVVVGDLLDRVSIDRVVEGAYGVFNVQDLEAGVDAEVQEGENIADATLAAGVERFMFNSVEGADPRAPLPYMVSNAQIESTSTRSGCLPPCGAP